MSCQDTHVYHQSHLAVVTGHALWKSGLDLLPAGGKGTQPLTAGFLGAALTLQELARAMMLFQALYLLLGFPDFIGLPCFSHLVPEQLRKSGGGGGT